MRSRALLIEVHLLDRRYHGVGDWPPAPFRLFQALVAGAYGGRWRAEPDDDKDAAFRWLESLAPPYIAAPPKIDGRATTYYVPDNDIDAVEGDLRRVSKIRSTKPVRPILLTADAPCLYAWRFDDGEACARRLCGFAERLHTLGLDIDAAFARAEVCDWSEAEIKLANYLGSVSQPGGPGDPDKDPFCPVRGSFDSLKKRHAAGVTRFTLRREGRASVTLFQQPPKAVMRSVTYSRAPARLLFDLRSAKDTSAFQPTAQERACEIVIAVRDLAARRLTKMWPQRAAEIDRLVVGRNAGATDIDRRIRIIPLPSIGHTHTSPSIRRVLVEIPPDCPISRNDLSVALTGQNLDGLDEATEELTSGAILVPADDQTMLRNYGIGGPAFHRWQTITPVALPQPKPRGQIRGSERVAANERASAAMADALRHAGLDWRGVAIRMQVEPFLRKGARADAFHPARFAGLLQHAEITFPNPISGPLMIGDGRWLGLGLLAPVREGPPAVHIFSTNPDEAPPLHKLHKLTRALRNAVMARVNDAMGGTRARRSENLPLLFTGHEEDGSPARSGRHEHLFFFADDADGDGKIDRLAVVAPHLADRGISYDPGRPSAMRNHLHVLDRALVGFTLLRAGHLGALSLIHMPEPSNDDPLFGCARLWVSRTPYIPTRHTKGGNIADAIVTDLIAECARRTLPRPEVEIVETIVGPRGGLAARARLQFKTAVHGPLLLGRASHFGAGVYGIV